MKKKPEEFRAIEHIATDLYNIERDGRHVQADEPGVRLWCTQNARTADGEGERWALQVRATIKVKSKQPSKHFAIGTASMSRKDLVWLRDLIHAELRKKYDGAPRNTVRRATKAKGTPGLVFHHEDDGGDGRYHFTPGTDDACACGALHETDRHGTPANDSRFGFQPPEAFCAAALVELTANKAVLK